MKTVNDNDEEVLMESSLQAANFSTVSSAQTRVYESSVSHLYKYMKSLSELNSTVEKEKIFCKTELKLSEVHFKERKQVSSLQ